VITNTFEASTDGFYLALGERQLRPLLDPGNGLVGVDQWPSWLSLGQRLQFFGNFPFGSIEAGEEYTAPLIEIIGDHGTLLQFEAECRLD
jgi:hypothetical protein